MRHIHGAVTLPALVLGLLVACGGGGGETSSPNITPPTPPVATGTVAAGQATTVQVPSGSLENAKVLVPTGALPTGSTVSISTANAPNFTNAAAGPVVQLTATANGSPIAAFTAPVTVSIPFSPSKIPAGKTTADLVIYTAPDGNGTPTVVPGAILDPVKSVLTGQVSHFSVFYVGVTAASKRTLSGTFRFQANDTAIWKSNSTGTPVYNQAFGNAGTFTFTAGGECTVAYTGIEFAEGYSGAPTTGQPNMARVSPESFSEKGTYTLGTDGHLAVQTPNASFSGYVSENGLALATGGVGTETRTDGTLYSVTKVLGVKLGTGKTLASLNGTYRFHSSGRSMWMSNTPPSLFNMVGGSQGTLTFDGRGGFTMTSEYKEAIERYNQSNGPWANEVAAGSDPITTESGTYTVANDGLVTVTLPNATVELYLSGDDAVLLRKDAAQRETRVDGTMHSIEFFEAKKVSAGLTLASLSGTYLMYSANSEMFKSSPAPSMVFNGMYGNKGTFVFDGKGGFSLTYAGRSFMEDYAAGFTGPWANNVRGNPEGETIRGTYTVSAQGELKLSITSTTYQLSPDGQLFSVGGPFLEQRNDGTLYGSMHMVGMKLQ